MPFNKQITGEENEVEFVDVLNKRKINELNPMLQSFMFDLYGELDETTEVNCYKNDKPQKSDIFIEVNGIRKSISIKKGVKNSVHVERITDFIDFLKNNGIKKEVINAYLEYQYADGSRNGRGEKRISSEEYKKGHQDQINIINKAFSNPILIKRAIHRFIIKGLNADFEIDALLYGVIDDFVWIKREDIYKVIIGNRDIEATGVHFGSIFCQPLDRCLNYNPLLESKRYCIQIKWYHLSDDIIKVMNDKAMESQLKV